jgi:hypothetical protein
MEFCVRRSMAVLWGRLAVRRRGECEASSTEQQLHWHHVASPFCAKVHSHLESTLQKDSAPCWLSIVQDVFEVGALFLVAATVHAAYGASVVSPQGAAAAARLCVVAHGTYSPAALLIGPNARAG